MLNTVNDDNISLKSLDNSYCSVCLSSLINDISKLSCNHSFHEKCINEWLKEKNTCPLCRSSIIRPNLDVLPIINNIRRHNNNQRYNYKKFLTLILTILILFNFCSNFYLDYHISKSNNHTSDLLIKNITLVTIKPDNERSVASLFILDMFYVMIYYYASSYIIVCKSNFCSVATISISCIINIGMHQMYIVDVFNRFENDIYEFSEKFKYNFIVSVILYGSSLFLKTVLLIIHVKINN
uniref:RING-type domain-containing protein n=1 Tax=viral metagenome TaxID=1070528 RepID=A0A6C0HWG6_9ZZZZ